METLENRLRQEIIASLKYDQADKTNEEDYDIGWNKSWYAGRILLLRELISDEQFQAMRKSAIEEME